MFLKVQALYRTRNKLYAKCLAKYDYWPLLRPFGARKRRENFKLCKIHVNRVIWAVFDKKSNEPTFITTRGHPKSPGVTKGQKSKIFDWSNRVSLEKMREFEFWNSKIDSKILKWLQWTISFKISLVAPKNFWKPWAHLTQVWTQLIK